MKKRKVLILIGDVGNGHRSGANAITYAFEKEFPNQFDVKTVDLFRISELWPYKVSAEMYGSLSTNSALEKLNNLAFRIANTKYLYDIFTNYTFTQLSQITEKIIEEEKPDVIISIHPIVSLILERAKEHQSFLSVVIVTDLITLFRGWADRNADLIFSPTPEGVTTLKHFGINPNKIIYPLFPINPKLKNFRSKEAVFKELNLDLNKNTVLVTGGGSGGASLNKAIENLAKNPDLQLIIIAGRSEDYKNSLVEKYNDNKNIAILGYVDNIQDYINACDLVIGKPGPATILEIELFDKKAILTKKIGEQEIGNIKYALRNPKFRYIGSSWSKLEDQIDELLSLKPSKVNNYTRRDFDESYKIVKQIKILLDNGETSKILPKRKTLENFLATTVIISAVGILMYKLTKKVDKK